MIHDLSRVVRTLSFPRLAVSIIAVLLAGCVSGAPVALGESHPANPKATSGYSSESTVLSAYKSREALVARADEDAAQDGPMQSMAGMDHGSMAGMQHGGVTPVGQAQSKPTSTATVNKIDAAQHKVNLSHDPIQAIGWPAMTMDFPVAPSVDLATVKPGSRVTFTMSKDRAGTYQIEAIQPNP